MKLCTKCNELKPDYQFGEASRTGLKRTECKKCVAKYQAAYRAKRSGGNLYYAYFS